MHFSFTNKNPTTRLGVLLDISISEINISIVSSNTRDKQPKILWSHTEKIARVQTLDIDKSILVAILNAFMEMVSTGFSSLRKSNISSLPDLVQVSIRPPFAYTISKNVFFKPKTEIKVTHKLIEELENKALREVKQQAEGELFAKNLNLKILSESTVALSLNGYPTHYPYNNEAKEIKLCQMVALGPVEIIEHVKRCSLKVLPEAQIDMDSFMSLYYRAITFLAPKTNEVCLVSVSNNYTELLIIRDGLPLSATSITTTDSIPTTLVAGGHEALEERLIKLFKQTGDGLSLPKMIYLHSIADRDRDNQPLVAALESSAKKVTGATHKVMPVNEAFSTAIGNNSSIMGCLAFVFHQKLYTDKHLEE